MPSVRRFSHVGNVIEADIHLGDMSLAASKGLTPVATYPNGAGYARLALNVKNKTSAQIVDLINSKLSPAWCDFEAFVTKDGKVGIRNRPTFEMPEELGEGGGTCYFLSGGEFGDLTDFAVVEGAVSAQSTIVHAGAWAFGVNGTIRASIFATTGAIGTTATDWWLRCWYYQTDTNAASWGIIAGVPIPHIGITSAQKLSLSLAGLAAPSVGATTITMDAWHLIEVHCWTADDPMRLHAELYLDSGASPECQLLDVNPLGADGKATDIDLGMNSQYYGGGTDQQFWDDVYVGTSRPGAGQCSVVCLAVGEGDDNEWVASAGDKHDCVNDYPWSDTDYVTTAGLASGYYKQTFTHDNGSGGYAGAASINAIGYWGRAGGDGVSGAVFYRMIESGATEAASGAHTSVGYEWVHPMFRDTDPTSAAWAEATVDALEIGGKSALVGPTVERRMSECYLFVDFIPGVAAGNVKKVSGVDWANVKKVSGVAEASIKKVSGVTAN